MRAAACSSRRSGSGRQGSLFIKLIQCQIEFDNVDDRLADIFHQRLLAVFCDQLRELFNAEITRFRHAWDLPPPLAGDVIVQPLADAVTSSTGTFVLASGLAARNAATRAAICLSSPVTDRRLLRQKPVDYRAFLLLPTGDHENSRCR